MNMPNLRHLLVSSTVLLAISLTSQTARPADSGKDASAKASSPDIPTEWTDPSTGYKVIRLTRRQGPNLSFYFHNNPFVLAKSDVGDQMLFNGRTDDGMQLFSLNLNTLKARQLTERARGVRGEILAPKLRQAFYQSANEIYAVDVDSGTERLVATLPDELRGGISTINADGTLLAGTHSPGRREILQKFPKKGDYFDRIFEANLPSQLFMLDLRTGKTRVVHEEVAWLNHLQFSPTDINLLMYCHEGPWHKLHRIWLIDIATKEIQKIHERTVEREIAGHEFWAPDGKTIWFDLQVPRGETFFLAGYNLASMHETRYSLTRNEWSVHYNVSPDQKLFCGDGGGENSVAHAPNGKWIYLFKPDGDKLTATRLVDLHEHDYQLEPNAHFSPDGRWIIFRSNMHGVAHIYAVVLK